MRQTHFGILFRRAVETARGMHVATLRSKLDLHLADKHATWADGAASWSDADGAHVLVLSSPLTTGAIVDAVALALEKGDARPIVAYEGAVSDVARRSAARFGVTLLDAGALPAPHDLVEIPPRIVSEMVLPELPAHEAPLLLAPHVEPAPVVAPVLLPAPVPPSSQAPAQPPVVDVFPPLPWATPAVEPTYAPIHVAPHELLALPWHEELGDHHEVTVTDRKPAGGFRPSQMPSWGLPWPRPLAPTDGLAIADPKLWSNQQRMQAVRDDLESRGGSSFGTFKAEGSAWLRRLQNFP